MAPWTGGVPHACPCKPCCTTPSMQGPTAGATGRWPRASNRPGDGVRGVPSRRRTSVRGSSTIGSRQTSAGSGLTLANTVSPTRVRAPTPSARHGRGHRCEAACWCVGGAGGAGSRRTVARRLACAPAAAGMGVMMGRRCAGVSPGPSWLVWLSNRCCTGSSSPRERGGAPHNPHDGPRARHWRRMGRSVSSGAMMRQRVRPGSLPLSRRPTAGWRGHWSGAGKRPYARHNRCTKILHGFTGSTPPR